MGGRWHVSQRRVDELEDKVGPSGVEYIGGHGLRIQVNKGPNTWFQVVTVSSGKQTAMGLGRTKRISFAHAEEIGGMFKDWAVTHTMEGCKATAGRFRQLAQTRTGVRRVPYEKLETAWHEATAGSAREGEKDLELLADLSIDARSGGGGEGPEHEKLKEHVKQAPSILGLPQATAAESEYRLASHDSVDVMFCHGGQMVCVEVKSKISDTADIRRGIFQCIKYKAVTEAMLMAKGKKPNVRSVLVLGRRLPQGLEDTQKKLCVEVIEVLKASS